MILTLMAGLLAVSSSYAANSVRSDYETYAKLYPSHLEYCAGTTLQFIGGVSGGSGGHGFTYVNGLCKDDSKAYPQVKPCDGTEGYPGVGISVNSDFQNVNWVAVPTHSLLIDGDLREGKAVTNATVERLADEATRLKVFEGVVIKPELTKDSAGRAMAIGSPDYLRAMAKNSLGTDYGTRLARNLECVRVPFEPSRLQAIADDLNALNNSYYQTGKTYEWSGPKNNCAHVASELIAKAGVRDAIPKQSYIHAAIPRNGSYTLISIGYFGSIEHRDVYSHRKNRAEILDGSPWLPTQVGALAVKYPAFSDNDVFQLSPKALWFIPKDLTPSGILTFQRARAAFNDPQPESSTIVGNLRAWEKKYAAELKASRSKPSVFDSKEYLSFKATYADYIESQLEFVRRSLTSLGEKPAK